MHVSDFLAAAVQLTSGQDPELNFNAAEEQIDLAARRGDRAVRRGRSITNRSTARMFIFIISSIIIRVI